MVGPIIEMGIRWDIPVNIEIGNKGMDMVEGMAMGIETNKEGPMEGLLLRLKTHHTTPKGRVPYGSTPSRRVGGGQGNGDGNGEDKDDKNRKKYRDTKYDFEEENEEESDTEDSFEFEITPQQLSQVTPGGGVLKLTLTKRGPLKITTEAQKKPDPSQTTVKTVYGPTKEKEPLQGSESIKGKTAYIEGKF